MCLAENLCILTTNNAEPFNIWKRNLSKILKYLKAKLKSNFKIFKSKNKVGF